MSPEHFGPMAVADVLEIAEPAERAIVARDFRNQSPARWQSWGHTSVLGGATGVPITRAPAHTTRSLLRVRHLGPWFTRIECGVPGLANWSSMLEAPLFDLPQESQSRSLPPLILGGHLEELGPDHVGA